MERIENKKMLVGTVVSDKMDKTVTVEVSRTVRHPSFHKIMNMKKTYKVHDEDKVARVGDKVEFYQGRPISKTKYMHFYRVIGEKS